jgi:hypothetical protein
MLVVASAVYFAAILVEAVLQVFDEEKGIDDNGRE